MLLRNYLELFRQCIEKLEYYGYTESIEIREEIRPNKQAIIKANIVLVDRSVLHIKEYPNVAKAEGAADARRQGVRL